LEATCQRCHETLREADRYCSVCGLPQLMYVAEETPVLPYGDGDSNGEMVGITGSGVLGFAPGGEVAWRPALRFAAMLGVPAGVLCSGLTPIGQSLGLVWMVGAAAWAVSLYARRSRTGGQTGGQAGGLAVGLTMKAGARIGLVTGLFAGWLTLAVNGAQLWLSRFAFHQGAEIDSLLQSTVEKSLQLSQQMIVGMGVASAQMAQSQQLNRAMMMSAEGRAGMVLSGFLSGAAFLVLFAVVGGAVGARFLAQPRRPSA